MAHQFLPGMECVYEISVRIRACRAERKIQFEEIESSQGLCAPGFSKELFVLDRFSHRNLNPARALYSLTNQNHQQICLGLVLNPCASGFLSPALKLTNRDAPRFLRRGESRLAPLPTDCSDKNAQKRTGKALAHPFFRLNLSFYQLTIQKSLTGEG